jgi:hypothetical protein
MVAFPSPDRRWRLTKMGWRWPAWKARRRGLRDWTFPHGRGADGRWTPARRERPRRAASAQAGGGLPKKVTGVQIGLLRTQLALARVRSDREATPLGEILHRKLSARASFRLELPLGFWFRRIAGWSLTPKSNGSKESPTGKVCSGEERCRSPRPVHPLFSPLKSVLTRHCQPFRSSERATGLD